MIDLYFAPTPNGLKVRLFLEEAQLPYRIIPVRLSKGEQYHPDYLAIAPNARIPAIVDHAPRQVAEGDVAEEVPPEYASKQVSEGDVAEDAPLGDEPSGGGPPLAMFESGAIMLYLADKIGRLIPTDTHGRAEVLQWLFWQMSALGPMAGQAGHFNVFAPERVPYAIDRYASELRRLYGVLDHRLDGREFIAREFSIADIACYPWIVPHRGHGQHLEDFPHLQRWFEAMHARPATQRVYAGVEDVYAKPRAISAEERRILFGRTAPASR
jgi:GSH-dependent disulfide-bond oxidoreductase